jgi:hypothetical protein
LSITGKQVGLKEPEMKTLIAEFKKPPDLISEEPTVSFSHLASCFSESDTGDDNAIPAHGFPASREESLYETGILLRDFLKC